MEKINDKENYSKIGKYSAKKFSILMNRSAYLDKILKNKHRKKIVEEDYFDRNDNESLDNSEDKDSIDIFDSNYKIKYDEFIRNQRKKYFNFTKVSCGKNKDNLDNDKKYRYHILSHKLLNIKKNKESEKLQCLDENLNNDFIYHKIAYSQSFYKMLGRYDQEKLREIIDKKIDEKNNNKICSKKLNKEEKKEKNKSVINGNSEKNINTNNKKDKIKKNLKKLIRGVGMDKQLERGLLPIYHDVRIRTAKGLQIKKNYNHKLIRNISSGNSSIFINRNKDISKNNIRIFSSITPNNKNTLLIKKSIDNTNNIEENRKDLTEKRIYSGIKETRNIIIKNHPNSSLENNNNKVSINSEKKVEFNSENSNNNRTFSSIQFNKLYRNIYSGRSNYYSFMYKPKSKRNNNDFHYMIKSNKKNKKYHPFSSTSQNKAISFKKMLSRQYVNEVKNNARIIGEFSLTPKYSLIYPKVVMKVIYNTKSNSSKQKDFKGISGEEFYEVNKKNNFLNNKISNFSKMLGRGVNIDQKYPIFMNNLNSRNAINNITEKSLKMNNFSIGKLNKPFSSFNNKKTFNYIIKKNNIDNNRSKSSSNSNINRNKKYKESRIDCYNNNIDNIFKKIIYDDIVDNNLSEGNEELFDLRKNPNLVKTINLSYKNLISDYYRLNLDYLDKDTNKDKIDGVTFEVIRNHK